RWCVLAISIHHHAAHPAGRAGGPAVPNRRRAAHVRPGVPTHARWTRLADRSDRHVHLSCRLRELPYGHHLGLGDALILVDALRVRRLLAAGRPRSGDYAMSVMHPSRQTKRRLVSIGMLLVVLCVWVVYLFPVVWLLMMSVKTQVDIFSKVPLFIFTPTLDHYREQLTDERFLHALRNSLIVTFVAAVFSMFLGSLAAYSLARFKLSVTTWLAVGLLLARMIPPIVFVVPLFLLYNAANLRNSLPGLA